MLFLCLFNDGTFKELRSRPLALTSTQREVLKMYRLLWNLSALGGSTIRFSSGRVDSCNEVVRVLAPSMVCFRFRRNKVSPSKHVDLPDTGSTVPESLATPVSSESFCIPANSGSSPAIWSTVVSRDDTKVAADGGALNAGFEDVEIPVSQEEKSITDLSDSREFTKRTYGLFDVYSALDDVDKTGAVTVSSERPLVILIPWLNAKERHVHKYCRLYLEKGMDVLLMQVSPMQIVRPLRTKEVIGRLLKQLKEKESFLAGRPLIIHGFSIGAFVWGQLLVEMAKADGDILQNDVYKGQGDSMTDVNLNDADNGDRTPGADQACPDTGAGDDAAASGGPSCLSDSKPGESKKTDVRQRILGVVMDSPTPVETMLDGIPSSISSNAAVKAVIRRLLASYFRLFPSSVAAHYLQGEEAVETNPGQQPILMLYSSADVIAPSRKVEAIVADWERCGFTVYTRKWDDSPHVGHFRYHPEQYKEELRLFLEKLNLTKAKL